MQSCMYMVLRYSKLVFQINRSWDLEGKTALSFRAVSGLLPHFLILIILPFYYGVP